MERAFDPYHIWLGIPSEEQPPNHYRLLGVKPFECNLDVIQNAADRQMVHLRTFQTGRHMEFSQRLLNEVAAAKVCLLNASKKAAYDAQLRALIEQKPPLTATHPPLEETTDPALTFLAEQSERRFQHTLARPRAKKIQGTHVATMVGASIAAVLLFLGFLVWNSPSREKPSSSPKATTSKRIARPPVVRKEKQKDAPPAAKSNDRPPPSKPSEPSAAFRSPSLPRIAFGKWFHLLPSPNTLIGWDMSHADFTYANRVIEFRNSQAFYPTVVKDVSIRARAKKLGGENILLILRYTDKGFYSAWFNGGRNFGVGIQSYKRFVTLKRRKSPQSHDDWFVFGFTAVGDVLTLFVDGKPLLQVRDQTHEAGSVAIGAYRGSGLFSDVELLIPSKASLVADNRKPPPDANRFEPRKILPIAQPPEVSETTREQLLPVPGDKEQKEAMKRARELFADECSKAETVEEKREVAKKILGRAKVIVQNPVEAFVLFQLAREVSLQAADGETAFLAIDAMAERYRVDAVEMKFEVLKDLAKKAHTPLDHALLAEQILDVMDLAASEDKYPQALELGTLVLAEAAKTRDKELRAVVRPPVNEVRKAARKYAAFEAARVVLAKKPDDREANFTAVEYLCFVKGDWETGLPHLAKGTDAELKALAEREISSRRKRPPAETTEQIQLANAWWDLARKAKGSKKDAIRRHAATWYEQARGEAAGLDKALIEKRLKEVAKIERSIPTAIAALANARADIVLEPDRAKLHGRGINVEHVKILSLKGEVWCINWWLDPQAWASWNKVSFRFPGIYEVSVLAARPDDKSELMVTIGNKKLVGEVLRTGSYLNFQTFTLGRIELERPGELMVAVRPRDAKTWKPINLARLTLKNVANINAADRPRRGRFKPVPGKITVSFDDVLELYVNGEKILGSNRYRDVLVKDHDFAKGDVIAVKCVNTRGLKGFTCVIQFEKRRTIITGDGWRAYMPRDDRKEWFDPKNIGRVFPVVPGNSGTRNNVLKACGVGAWEIWGSSGDSCYLLYIVP